MLYLRVCFFSEKYVISIFVTFTTMAYSRYILSDLGVSSNLIGSLSLASSQSFAEDEVELGEYSPDVRPGKYLQRFPAPKENICSSIIFIVEYY